MLSALGLSPGGVDPGVAPAPAAAPNMLANCEKKLDDASGSVSFSCLERLE
jgi:hypothetical protein